ncbi:MAG: hypothetical protein C0483_18355 [Pirellula sp.]|nr:hypothetical protein [Pirellula sp.]
MLPASPDNDWHSWILERRIADGAILVRVPAARPDSTGRPLPDAVFSFRDGDPQYRLWADRFAMRNSALLPQRTDNVAS